jgi:molecular chaperone DnaK
MSSGLPPDSGHCSVQAGMSQTCQGTKSLRSSPLRVMVFDQSGNAVPDAETRIAVKRTDASSAGTPITHTIAVKVVTNEGGIPKNTLHELVAKGQSIPASGTENYRAANDLKGGDAGGLDFEVYQMEAGVADPTLNLHVGNFPIEGADLDPGDIIRRGDIVRVHWNLDENGLLNCALEVPSIGRRFDTGKMFTDQGAKKSFEGQEGEDLANSVLDTTATEIDELQRAIGTKNSAEADELNRRLEEQRANLKTSFEADTRRSIVEEGRAIRQEISRTKNRPENIGAILTEETDRLVQDYNSIVKPHAPRSTNALVEQVHEALRHGRVDDARKSHTEMTAIFLTGAKEHPGFQVEMFLALARERHLAIDKALHDRLVTEGQACVDRNDLEGLRRAIGRMLENQIPKSAKKAASAALAGLMKQNDRLPLVSDRSRDRLWDDRPPEGGGRGLSSAARPDARRSDPCPRRRQFGGSRRCGVLLCLELRWTRVRWTIVPGDVDLES